ncbi:MAG: hypothetical protein Q8J86_13140 [Desulfurivibrionaceae bacterium]|nr:hypothetical protein [Desulfurivibrionaceae bacterium]
MDKYDLLKTVGFSEEYISHMKKFDENETSVFESTVDEYMPISFDTTNIIFSESKNNFSTKLMFHQK